jgi:hypothetical protein
MQKMIGKMARMYPMFVLLGFMVVIAAFAIGYLNSQNAAQYFSETKIVRETTLMAQRASIESVGIWLPYFKFLGVGLLLSGIVMALRVIIDDLKQAGVQVLNQLPTEKRPSLPRPHWYGLLMPLVMMTGLIIFIAAFVISLSNAAVARQVFANALPVIDTAGSGSVLLGQLLSIQVTSAWLVPLKFFGIATEFLAIAMGLGTILYTLNSQIGLIQQGIQIGRSASKKLENDLPQLEKKAA